MHDAMRSSRFRRWRERRAVEVGWVAGAVYITAVAALAVLEPAGVAVLAGLTVLVLIHEGGHLVVAQRCGIEVSEFFAGFGPVVLAWRTPTGLRVGLKAIPAGGYVKVVGMTGREEVDPALEPRTFRAAGRGRRLAVVAAGPIVNVVFGFVLLLGAAVVEGQTSLVGMVADAWTWTLEVSRGTLQGLAAVLGDVDGYGAAVLHPANADAAPTRFLSPVGVAQIATDLAAIGPGVLIRLLAVASIGLGVMNALPLPPLDGGHAVLVGIEKVVATVRRQPALRLDTTNRAVAAVTAVTFALVIVFGASAVAFDVASPLSLR